MFARVELAVRPDLIDTVAQETLRQIELTHPEIRKKIRWARFLEVYWFEVALSREEFIPVATEVCWDKVSQWMFSGNLMPSAAGKTGSLVDLMEASPYRPGVFWGIERRFRSGIVDSCGKALLEALEIVLGRSLPQSRVCSGGLLLLEGPELREAQLSAIARDVFAHELTQTWTLLPEENFKKNDRFHQERVRFDLPRLVTRENSTIERIAFLDQEESEIQSFLLNKKCFLSSSEIQKMKKHLNESSVQEARALQGLSQMTDVELALISGVGQKVKAYPQVPFKKGGGSEEKPWILSSFCDGSATLRWDEETTVSLALGVRPLTSSLEPHSAVQSAILKSQYAILQQAHLGSHILFNAGALLISDPLHVLPAHSTGSGVMLDDRLHPRRVFQSAIEGFQGASQLMGIPHLNGAIWVGPEFDSLPAYFAVSGGMTVGARAEGEKSEEEEEAKHQAAPIAGDELFYLGSPIGRDAVQGQTPSIDLLTHQRILEFLADQSSPSWIQASVSGSLGGLGAALVEMALQVGGIQVQLSHLKTRQAGLKPYELLMSETQERLLVCVSSRHQEKFFKMAEQRNIPVMSIGRVTSSRKLEMSWQDQKVADLDPEFLMHHLFERLISEEDQPAQVLESYSPSEKSYEGLGSFPDLLNSTLLLLLGSPSIASKESIIRQCDHEVQGASVLKSLHVHLEANAKASSGPNDAAVLRLKWGSDQGLAFASGLSPNLMRRSPFLMAQAAVDECVRNLLCTGAEYQASGPWMGFVAGWVWGSNPEALRSYSQASQGLTQASQALGVPLLSTEVSWRDGASPALYVGGVGRVSDLRLVIQSQFRMPGDRIYVLGPAQLGILGAEIERVSSCTGYRAGEPHWPIAQRVYGWLGGEFGSSYPRLQSIHDVSDGGVLVAITEGLVARGLGVTLHFPADRDPWELGFGEGFHTFVVSVAKEDVNAVEQSWKEFQIPFLEVGTVENHGRLDYWSSQENKILSSIPVSQLKSAWLKEGYWE